MKRILLVAGVVAIGLIVTVCVHAASTTVAEKAAANDPEASLPVVTEPAEPAPTQPVEPEATEPAQPAEPAEPATAELATAEPAPQENSGGGVSEETAKETALATAGVKESDTTYLYVMPEYDDGRSVYNVEFLVGTTEYEFEIDANTGQVLEYDADSMYD